MTKKSGIKILPIKEIIRKLKSEKILFPILRAAELFILRSKLILSHNKQAAQNNESHHCYHKKSIQPYVLFIMEKWCDSDPKSGISNSEHNLFGSLEEAGLARSEKFHFDEYYYLNQCACDSYLLQLCSDQKPDLIVFTYLLHGKHNPRPETFKIIHENMNIPIIAIWFDSVRFDVLFFMELFRPVVNLNVVLDSASSYPNMTHHQKKFLSIWTPQDPRIFYNPKLYRDIDVSFAGSIRYHSDRQKGIGLLKQNNINICHAGGQRESRISPHDYAKLLMRSKITLNFSRQSYYGNQLKGRVFEAILCGAMLMESENNETSRWFEPMTDYVPFKDEHDLLDKTKYYLEQDNQRVEIAENGYKKAKEKYNNKIFWQTLFDKIFGDNNTSSDP